MHYPYTNLTSALRDRHSPLREYLDETFPHTLQVRQRYEATAGPIVVESHGADAATIGSAFDLQTKFLLDPEHVPEIALVAFAGHQHALAAIYAVVTVAQNAGARRAVVDEGFARACWALALTTGVYRSGRLNGLARLGAPATWTPSALLGLTPPSAISELRELAELALVKFVPHVGQPLYLAPTFEASAYCNADADLIDAGTLVELKTRLGAKRKAGRVDVLQVGDLYQVLAYCFFDHSDRYRLQRVGFYSGRYGHYVAFQLDELLNELAGRPISLTECREHVWRLLGAA